MVGSQASVVHGLPSLQMRPAPALHAELAQTSPVVHALPSLHGSVLAVNTQPVAELHASLVQALLSLQIVVAPGTQLPPAQASPTVQTLPSEQLPVVLVKTQPVAELQVSAVHGLPSLHVTAAPPAHAPAAHASPLVHALPSEHVLVLLAWMQPPPTLHESVVHGLPSSQLIAAPDAQPPPAHTSPLVHALLSEHDRTLLVYAQPLVGSQASSVQMLPSLQTTTEPGWHAPVAQMSPLVQALLSVQDNVLLVCVQPPDALQESVVHRLLSSHASAAPGTQTPLAHASFVVHALPSVQANVLLVKTQPVAGTQASVVHGLPSLQTTPVPPAHEPLAQMSPWVHALPSEQARVLLVCVQPFCASHSSVVHGLLSSHGATLPPVQTPNRHVSFSVQELPSSHAKVLAVKTQPVVALQLSVVHGLPSEHGSVLPGWQVPPEQVSPSVQTLPSEQLAVVLVCVQPATGSQLSAVHGLKSSQLATEPGTHAPPLQTSPTVQPLLSLQPSLLTRNVQPSVALHVSVVHGLPSLHGSDAPGMHAPPEQTSPWVQMLLSLHASALFTLAQPVVGLQESVVHRLPSSQLFAAPGTQVPAAHASPTVQALPSEHPVVDGVNTQPPAAVQVSVVQGLPSLQVSVVPGTQMPPEQASPDVHELPSEHGRVLFDVTQPLDGSQASVVHGLVSSQMLGAPGTHSPPTQASPTVHRLPSVQVPFVFVLTQPPVGLQVSLVHGLPSLHGRVAPATQTPPEQASPDVHELPSEQATVLLVVTQPLSGSQASLVQMLLSSQVLASPGAHWPLLQMSPTVHRLPSVHVPLVVAFTQPVAGSQLSAVHGLPSLHTSAAPAMQAPDLHASPRVHALPSEQPASVGWNTQPLSGSQKSMVHALSSEHVVNAPGRHTPVAQLSPTVHALASLHVGVVPLLTQPWAGSQMNAVQTLAAAQSLAMPGWQAPLAHPSLVVQALPSSQGAALLANSQPVCGRQ